MADMKGILNGIRELAALPQTVLQLTGLLSSGKSSAGEIEQIARRDEAVSMTILRWANSAKFGRSGGAFTLKESIARLGNSELLKIVLRQKTAGLFARAGEAYGLQRGAMWRSALGGALAAEQISRDAKFEERELCFLCALLRDIGKLAFDAHFGHDYIGLVGRHQQPDRTFIDAERAAFGFDHAQLGAELAIRWNLPTRIVDAVANHHCPPAAAPSHDVLFDIVHAADIICLWAGLAIGYDGLQYILADHVRLRLNIDRPKAERWVAQTSTKLSELEKMMNKPMLEGAHA